MEYIDTKNMTRSEWVESRKSGIGGSDAAAIVGLSPYSTPYTVWADKTGRIPPVEDNEAMRQGRDLEEYVAYRFCEETGKRCRRKNAILKNTDYPFAHANVDRWVVSENAGLECKTTTTLSLKKFKNGEFPDTYYCQCMHYMAVTGADRWYLAVLVLGREFMVYTIERDEEEIAALMDQESVFWGYVERDEEPPVDGLDPTGKAIGVIYADVQDDGVVDLMGMESNIRSYQDIKATIKGLEKQLKQQEQEIKVALGESPKGIVGGFTVNWKPQERKTFQTKDFVADHPEMDLGSYYKTTAFRKFEIKEDK